MAARNEKENKEHEKIHIEYSKEKNWTKKAFNDQLNVDSYFKQNLKEYKRK